MTSPLTIPGLLDELAARRAAAEAEITELREQIGNLSAALASAERERDRWACTAETVLALAAEDQPEPAVLIRASVTPAYRQIIAVFTDGASPLRAKEICRALGTGTDPRHVEGMRLEAQEARRPRHPDRDGRPVHPRGQADRATRGCVDPDVSVSPRRSG